LRYAEGLWYWNWTYTGEFMLQSTLWLSDCHKVDFIKHHDTYCSIGGCNDRGKDGDRAAGRIIAYVLSRGINIIDDPLITTKQSLVLCRRSWIIAHPLCARGVSRKSRRAAEN
jgi:transposase